MSEDRSNSRYGRIAKLVNVPTLAPKRFTMIGMGSMGQPVACQMVRHGVATDPTGRLRLIDGDFVKERNFIGTDYLPAHLNMPKAQVVAGMIREINDAVNVSYWERRVSMEDIPQIVAMAGRSDLLGLFADDFEIMMAISEKCTAICPQVMAIFGPQADYAEVAFSVPGVTPPLSRTIGTKARTTIGEPSALGCDTLFVSSFVSSLCLSLLLGEAKGSELLPCYANASLFAVGLRRAWVFAGQPQDFLRSIVCIETSSTTI